MMHICVIAELLAVIALIMGMSVPIAGTAALLAATPASAVTIGRILKTEKSFSGVVDTAFLFFTWALLPCLLALHATDGVGENVFRLIVSARVFAAVSIWRHSSQWKQTSTNNSNNDDECVEQELHLETQSEHEMMRRI